MYMLEEACTTVLDCLVTNGFSFDVWQVDNFGVAIELITSQTRERRKKPFHLYSVWNSIARLGPDLSRRNRQMTSQIAPGTLHVRWILQMFSCLQIIIASSRYMVVKLFSHCIHHGRPCEASRRRGGR